jgi:transmembrane sensor
MNKQQLEDLLTRYQQGNATPYERSMIDAYMLVAEKNNADFFDEEKVVIGDRLWTKLKPMADVHSMQPKANKVHSIQKVLFRFAAACLIIVGLGTIGYKMRHQIVDMVDPIASISITTNAYEIKRITLPDSSHVVLAQNSRLSYPVRYRQHSRNVTLNGTAFFEIEKNPAAPFIVKSINLDVAVLGTSFEVNDADKSQHAVVSVVTGRVKVSNGKEMATIVTRNQQVAYNVLSQQAIVNNIDAASATAWIKKQFVFNETALTDVLKTLQAHYNIKLEIVSGILDKGYTFSGSFDYNEPVTDVLDVICFSSGLQYATLAGGGIIIRK